MHGLIRSRAGAPRVVGLGAPLGQRLAAASQIAVPIKLAQNFTDPSR